MSVQRVLVTSTGGGFEEDVEVTSLFVGGRCRVLSDQRFGPHDANERPPVELLQTLNTFNRDTTE